MGWHANARWVGIMALLVTLVAAALALSYWQAAQGNERARDVMASEERIGSLVTLLSIMQDAETGQRGYLITGLDGYLEPYETALRRLGNASEVLEDQQADRAELRLAIAHVRKLIGLKLDELALTIALSRSQGFEAAREVVLNHTGNDTMNELRQGIAFLISVERTHMLGAERGHAAAQERSHAVFVLLSAVVSVSMGTLLLLAARETRASHRANAKLEYLASHDQLTGLANRRSLHGALERAIQAGKKSGQRPGLFFMDLNGFKGVNDRFGHEAGDRLLLAVAESLKATTRASDVLARLGGDEFALLVPHLASDEDSDEIARRIRDAVAAAGAQAPGCRVSASVGVAVFPDHARTSAGLLSVADQRMYADKRHAKHLPGMAPDAGGAARAVAA